MTQNVAFDVQQRARLACTARAASGREGPDPAPQPVPVPRHKLHLAPTPAALRQLEATQSQQMTNTMVGSLPPHAYDGHASAKMSWRWNAQVISDGFLAHELPGCLLWPVWGHIVPRGAKNPTGIHLGMHSPSWKGLSHTFQRHRALLTKHLTSSVLTPFTWDLG